MIRIEYRTVVELPFQAQPLLGAKARREVLQKEIDRVIQDPIGYQETHDCNATITGYLMDGPVASTCIQKMIDTGAHDSAARYFRSLEPLGFPAA